MSWLNNLKKSKKKMVYVNVVVCSLLLLAESVVPFFFGGGGVSTATAPLKTAPPMTAEVMATTPKKNRREARFDALLDELSFSDEQLVRVADSRLATILVGARASRDDAKVRRAFEILYCDVAPIRLGGELVFRQLVKTIEKNMMTLDEDHATLLRCLETFDAADVVAARELFQAIDSDGDKKLSREELLRFGLLKSLGQCENCRCNGVDTCQSLDRFVKEVDGDGLGHVSFLDFMLNASRALYKSDADIASALRPKNGNADKFDDMVKEFATWSARRRKYRENNPKTDDKPQTRLGAVLDGCFSGAENKQVVDALRVVFQDYDSLRVCAELIFKLMRNQAKNAPWYDYDTVNA